MSAPQEIVAPLQEWHGATEAASRNNRNLIQYGAALAGLIGIEAGFGGVVAVALSVADSAQDGPLYGWVIGLAVAGFILGVMLAVLVVRAFHERHAAEQRADAAMRTLITHMPDRFLPGTEELVPVLATDNA